MKSQRSIVIHKNEISAYSKGYYVSHHDERLEKFSDHYSHHDKRIEQFSDYHYSHNNELTKLFSDYYASHNQKVKDSA